MATLAEDENEEEYYEEEISDEEKVKIATHFLMSSPPAEIREVEKDVRRIVPSNVFTDDMIVNTYRKYNLANFVVAKTPDGSNMLVCSAGEVDNTHYTDPRAKKVYGFDHREQKWLAEDGSYEAGSAEDARDAVQAAVDKYVSSYYRNDKDAKSCAAVYSTSDGKLEIRICGVASDLRNYWSGTWRSSYTVDLGSNEISGSSKLLAHYFEDGNVQMKTSQNFKGTFTASEGDALGTALTDMIKKFESDLHNELGEMYTTMSADTFKDMRRVLPVTKQKFDWSGVSSKLNSTMSSSS
jgi:capping protein alpha